MISPEPERVAMEPPETILIESLTVGCDGGPMGHPLVYLNLGEARRIDCPYCGRRYIYKENGEGVERG